MSFRELLNRRGIRFHRSHDPNEIYICCLFCHQNGESEDTRFRLGINLVSGVGHCFNCGWKSRKAIYHVMRNWGVLQDYDVQQELQAPPEVPELPRDFQLLSYIDTDLDRMAVRYLKNRGITGKQISNKKIGVSFIGRYAYRIVFPVLDRTRLVGFTARDFTGAQNPKYLHSPGEKGLYNLNSLQHDKAIISEGTFKALRIEQLNTGWASLACLGHDLTDLHIRQLKQRQCQKVTIWPDPDTVGRRGALNMVSRLMEEGFQARLIWPVTKPADEQSLPDMLSTFHSAQDCNWALQQKVMLNAL